MTRSTLLVLATTLTVLLPGGASAQVKHYPLEATDGLLLHNVAAEPAVLQGKKGLRVTFSEETVRRFKDMTPEEQAEAQARVGQYAIIEGLEFANGVIEAEIAGAVAPGGAYAGARGFVGIAFRLQNATYDAFYLRPTNGRAEDQERRNHAIQYVSHPDWPWFRLRKEFPSKYESYVDLMPGVWTKIKIDVRGERARLYVHGQEQPTLIVNDLKSGAQGKARQGKGRALDRQRHRRHFRNMTVKLDPDAKSPPVR